MGPKCSESGRVKPTTKLPRIITKEERTVVFKIIAKDFRIRATVQAFLATGMEFFELESLIPDNVDLREGVGRVSGKGNKERHALISPDRATATDILPFGQASPGSYEPPISDG